MTEPQPSVRIVRGQPDELELAALVAGLAATTHEHPEPELTGSEPWSNRARLLRGAPLIAGDDAWRWSLRG